MGDEPDQYIYETVGKDEPYVRLVSTGPVGEFNRAQRGIDSTREIFTDTVVKAVFAGYVFPKAVFVIAILFFFARALYSHCYMKSANNFSPVTLLSVPTDVVLSGLQLFAGI